MTSVYAAGAFPDYRAEQMSVVLTDHYSTNATALLAHKSDLRDLIETIVTDTTTALLQSRRAPIAAYKKRLDAQATKRVNESDSSRFIRVMFVNPEWQPVSEFSRRLDGVLSGEEWVMPESDADLLRAPAEDRTHISSKSHISGMDQDGPDDTDAQPDTTMDGPKYPLLNIDDFTKVHVSLANDMYVDTPKNRRKYALHIELMSE
ncbi:MAG: hypothetical protein V2I33_18255, partial [Kangiellaceae bacterium]|nr:hypothetical protein [Kangiellaceae bacterium]